MIVQYEREREHDGWLHTWAVQPERLASWVI